MELNCLIYDSGMVKNFYNKILKGITDFEINFISVAARTKYLSDEEKTSIRLGHTQMLGKTIIKENDENKYLNKIRQLDAASNFYTDFNGNYIPRSCMVFYANINPTSVPKATYEFKKILADYDKEAFCIAESGDTSRYENLLKRYKNLSNNLLTCYQTQRSRKRWIDIDCDVMDVESDCIFNNTKKFCESNEKFWNVHPIGVITRGGLHILLNTDGLKDNPQKIVDSVIEYVKREGGSYKEILINKNEMVPLPGTLQGGFCVRMLE